MDINKLNITIGAATKEKEFFSKTPTNAVNQPDDVSNMSRTLSVETFS